MVQLLQGPQSAPRPPGPFLAIPGHAITSYQLLVQWQLHRR